MVNEGKIMSDLTRYSLGIMNLSEAGLKTVQILSAVFMEKLKNSSERDLLLDFYSAGENEMKLLKEGENLKILNYEVDPQSAHLLKSICERDGIKTLNFSTKVPDVALDGISDSIDSNKLSIAIYNTKQSEFELALREARLRSGKDIDIDISLIRGPYNKKNKEELEKKGIKFFDQKLKIENPIKFLDKPISKDKYDLLKQEIMKLPKDMRPTLIYEKLKNGDLNVGFLSRTEKLFDKKGNPLNNGQRYNIPQIMKRVMTIVNLIEKSNEYDLIKNNFERNDEIRSKVQETVEEINKSNPITIMKDFKKENVGREDLEAFYFLLKDKEYIKNKEKLKEIIKRQKFLSEKSKEEWNKRIDNIGKEIYIVPINIENNIANDNKERYILNTRDSIHLSKALNIREAGEADLNIKDPLSFKNNIEQKINEYCFKTGNSCVVLTKEEFEALELGKGLKKGKTLNPDKIEFMKENTEMFKRDLPKEVSKELIFADVLMEDLFKKRENFLLESENRHVNADFFLQNIDLTVHELETKENIIDINISQKVNASRNKLESVIKKDEEGEITITDFNLENSLYDSFSESEDLIKDDTPYLSTDTYKDFIERERQKDREEKIESIKDIYKDER